MRTSRCPSPTIVACVWPKAHVAASSTASGSVDGRKWELELGAGGPDTWLVPETVLSVGGRMRTPPPPPASMSSAAHSTTSTTPIAASTCGCSRLLSSSSVSWSEAGSRPVRER